jgi:hypothetical protein
MFSLTAPAIKSILLSLGFQSVQNDPPFGKPDAFYCLVKNEKEMLTFIKRVLGATQFFGAVKKDLPYESGYYRNEDTYVEVSGFKIFVKLEKNKVIHPKLTQGRENEQNFFNAISEYVDEYKIINIEFTENGRTELKVPNVVEIVRTSAITNDRKKADVTLITSKGQKIPISLKQIDAPGWESPETYWGEKSRNILEYALLNFPKEIKLPSKDGKYRISKDIAVEASSQEAKDLMFGSDIHPHGAVVKQTWQSNHFDWDHKFRTLTLETKYVLQNVSDVPYEDYPFFQIRNFENKNPKFLYPGLGILAVTRKAAKNSKILPNNAKNFINYESRKAS